MLVDHHFWSVLMCSAAITLINGQEVSAQCPFGATVVLNGFGRMQSCLVAMGYYGCPGGSACFPTTPFAFGYNNPYGVCCVPGIAPAATNIGTGNAPTNPAQPCPGDTRPFLTSGLYYSCPLGTGCPSGTSCTGTFVSQRICCNNNSGDTAASRRPTGAAADDIPDPSAATNNAANQEFLPYTRQQLQLFATRVKTSIRTCVSSNEQAALLKQFCCTTTKTMYGARLLVEVAACISKSAQSIAMDFVVTAFDTVMKQTCVEVCNLTTNQSQGSS